MNVNNRIAELRDKRGWSNYHLAKMSDVSPNTIQNLFDKKNPNIPSIPTLIRICDGFCISLAEFFNIDSESTILSQKQKDMLLNISQLTIEERDYLYKLIESISKRVNKDEEEGK